MYRLDRECFEEPFRFDRRTMRRFATKPGSIVLVADVTGELVGFAIFDVTRRGSLAYVVTLDVDFRYRRRGLAQSLMRAAELAALEQGVKDVRLHVYTGNTAALRFYEASGFVRLGLVQDFYGPGLDAVWCRKQIAREPAEA